MMLEGAQPRYAVRITCTAGDEGVERRKRAIAAALAVAAWHGVESTEPSVLHDSNNTIIRLCPAPLVAKVGTSPEDADLGRELDIAAFLTQHGAPVVRPTRL